MTFNPSARISCNAPCTSSDATPWPRSALSLVNGIVYVAYGAAIVYGIDLDAVFAEVHRSNMTKLDADGRVIYREDGKVLKSDRYTPPDIAGVLSRQPPLPF